MRGDSFGAADGGPLLLFSDDSASRPPAPTPPAAGCVILRRTSGSPCDAGVSYGCENATVQAPAAVWVDKGCAGAFQCAGTVVECDSNAFKRRVCPCLTRRTSASASRRAEVVMSPASSFMVGGLAPCGAGADAGTVCAGVRASYPYVPTDFGYDTLLVAGAC